LASRLGRFAIFGRGLRSPFVIALRLSRRCSSRGVSSFLSLLRLACFHPAVSAAGGGLPPAVAGFQLRVRVFSIASLLLSMLFEWIASPPSCGASASDVILAVCECASVMRARLRPHATPPRRFASARFVRASTAASALHSHLLLLLLVEHYCSFRLRMRAPQRRARPSGRCAVCASVSFVLATIAASID